METRAPFIIVGAFVLAAIGAVFGFVYWLHNTAGTGAREKLAFLCAVAAEIIERKRRLSTVDLCNDVLEAVVFP